MATDNRVPDVGKDEGVSARPGLHCLGRLIGIQKCRLDAGKPLPC